MNWREKIKILEELDLIEEEEKKYSLPVHVIFFNEDPDEPGTYWMGFEKKKKVTKQELDKYSTYNQVVTISDVQARLKTANRH